MKFNWPNSLTRETKDTDNCFISVAFIRQVGSLLNMFRILSNVCWQYKRIIDKSLKWEVIQMDTIRDIQKLITKERFLASYVGLNVPKISNQSFVVALWDPVMSKILPFTYNLWLFCRKQSKKVVKKQFHSYSREIKEQMSIGDGRLLTKVVNSLLILCLYLEFRQRMNSIYRFFRKEDSSSASSIIFGPISQFQLNFNFKVTRNLTIHKIKFLFKGISSIAYFERWSRVERVPGEYRWTDFVLVAGLDDLILWSERSDHDTMY